ncbi:uncharacterized protein LOC127526704 [Erpetoichthys calabaricus]|uniref:uncharacterized protein LOC127526704 n=1 Tax=Erpetoichthys calabaricus TaxID=27687 RepID=UPI002234A539|nr:uncharacterized protein LOC127526704 [Erpetoichthys calabaricus]
MEKMEATSVTMSVLFVLSFFVQATAFGSSVFQYPSSVSVNVGANVTLLCSIKQFSAECSSVWWFRLQKTSSVPTLLNTNTRKYLKTTMSKNCSLTIYNLEESESSAYYCALVQGLGIYFGPGSHVLVSRLVGDSISLVIFRSLDIIEDEVTLVCLASVVSFGSSRLYWMVNSNHKEGETEFRSHFIQSQVSIPTHMWKAGVHCTCILTTESGQNLNRTIKHKTEGCFVLMSSLLGVSFPLVIVLIILTVQCNQLQHSGRENEIIHLGTCSSSKVNKKRQEKEEVQYATIVSSGRRR